MPRRFQFSLRAIFWTMATTAVGCMILPPLFHNIRPSAVAFLACWFACLTGQGVLTWSAIKESMTRTELRLTALILSALGSLVPASTFLLFLLVFVIGGSSNVAQLAGEPDMGLWRLWFNAWPMLLFGTALSGLVSLATALSPPYPPQHVKSFVSRWCGVASAAFSWYVVTTFFPDA